MMQFAYPVAFIMLVVFILLLFINKKARTIAIPFKSRIDLSKLPKPLRIIILRPLLFALYTSAIMLLIIALARPQHGSSFIENEEHARDIIIALDSSGSMQAMDFFIGRQRVDRMSALKSVVADFIKERRGDRIGLVVFGSEAYVQCPLTSDSNALLNFIEALEIGMAGEQTAVGDAIAVSLKLLRNIESDSKVVVLVTDGENNSGKILPLEAAALAKELEIKIYAIGIGEDGIAPFPMKTPFGQQIMVNRRIGFDEKTLINIATETGARYFAAKNTDQLRDIYQEIDKLEQRIAETYVHISYEERYMLYALNGLIIFVVALFINAIFFVRLP